MAQGTADVVVIDEAVSDQPEAAAEPTPAAPTPAGRHRHGAHSGGHASSRFRGDVEGLRAVAVGLVVLFHTGLSFLPGGFVGVDVFFVISGFLITTQLASEVN